MHAGFLEEVARAGLEAGPGDEAVVTEADLAPLPVVMRRYFRAMGAVGKPRTWSFRATFEGRFRIGRHGAWVACQAAQYNTRVDLSRLFQMRTRFFGVVPVVARDTYVHGQGHLTAKLLDLVTVADDAGPALDVGELATYLNDAVLMAPTMLLGPGVTWRALDAERFEVTLADARHVVTGQVALGGDGRPREFTTGDRFFIDATEPDLPPVRHPWSTPVSAWTEVEGRAVMARGQAVWSLPEGPLPYADFTLVPADMAFNVRPGA